jgi:ATP-dependent Clp endopeptidase proteolytic subunit ClpP
MALPKFSSLNPVSAVNQLVAFLNANKQPENTGRGWYSIENKSQAEAEVCIYDEIGFWGVTAADFIKDFSAIKAGAITLRVNSPGGDVYDGIAIYNAISRHPASVTAYVDGIAASAASFLLMAADDVVMSPHSQLMIHEASGLVMGNAEDMHQMADVLDKVSDNIAGIYAEKAGGTTEEWRGRMKAETWLSDSESVALGLADRMEGQQAVHNTQEQEPKAIDWSRFLAQMEEEAAELVA